MKIIRIKLIFKFFLVISAGLSQANDVSKADSDSLRQPKFPPAVLPGMNADPHIAVFGDTYYLYPTTDDDNINYWSSTSFRCWSSKNLKDWKNEGIILDLNKDITWAKDKAGAPCIAARNGKYYFYFSAGQSIGMAESDRPQGPFRDCLGKPLISKDAYNTQVIDPMVFIDDDKTAYLYFDSGMLRVVKLNDDMISFDPGAVKFSCSRQMGFITCVGLIMAKEEGIVAMSQLPEIFTGPIVHGMKPCRIAGTTCFFRMRKGNGGQPFSDRMEYLGKNNQESCL